MGFLDWLLGLPSFHRYEDSFTLKRQHLWHAIRLAIERCLAKQQTILAITHFASTFSELQNRLAEWDIGYEIISRPLDNQWFAQQSENDAAKLMLALSPLLSDLVERKTSKTVKQPLAMIVCERHPSIEHDKAIEAFARKAPIPTQLGYFLALDDVVIRNTISPSSIELLQQLGLSNQQLITSHMVTRRLNKVLGRNAKARYGHQQAESPEEWYALNESANG